MSEIIVSKKFGIIFAILFTNLIAIMAGPSIRSINSCNNCVCGSRGRGQRIVGGSVILPHDYPWLAGLRRQNKIYCGATLISPSFLVTAAHCVKSFNKNEILIYLGGHDVMRDFSDVRRIKEVYPHEDFNIVSFNNDIALIEMDQPVKFSARVQPACLPNGDISDFSGQNTIVAGWGRLGEKDQMSNVIRSVVVPVWSEEQCKLSDYGNQRITENMMCGGYNNGGKDACQGDSGGPMLYEGKTGSMELIGIVSWGRGCARPNLPGIYTRIVNYLPWIRSKMRNECLCTPRNGVKTNFADQFIGKR